MEKEVDKVEINAILIILLIISPDIILKKVFCLNKWINYIK